MTLDGWPYSRGWDYIQEYLDSINCTHCVWTKKRTTSWVGREMRANLWGFRGRFKYYKNILYETLKELIQIIWKRKPKRKEWLSNCVRQSDRGWSPIDVCLRMTVRNSRFCEEPGKPPPGREKHNWGPVRESKFRAPRNEGCHNRDTDKGSELGRKSFWVQEAGSV